MRWLLASLILLLIPIVGCSQPDTLTEDDVRRIIQEYPGPQGPPGPAGPQGEVGPEGNRENADCRAKRESRVCVVSLALKVNKGRLDQLDEREVPESRGLPVSEAPKAQEVLRESCKVPLLHRHLSILLNLHRHKLPIRPRGRRSRMTIGLLVRLECCSPPMRFTMPLIGLYLSCRPSILDALALLKEHTKKPKCSFIGTNIWQATCLLTYSVVKCGGMMKPISGGLFGLRLAAMSQPSY